jgi:hypothetical protein
MRCVRSVSSGRAELRRQWSWCATYTDATFVPVPTSRTFVPLDAPAALTDEIVKSLRHQVNQHVRPGAPQRAFA